MKLNLKFIKQRRLELGLNQDEVATALGMNGKANYSRYENGLYTFDSNHVPLLAKVLQVSIDDLYTQKVSKIEI